MSVNRTTNRDEETGERALDRVLTGIEDGEHVLLCSHIRSDPDAIGSELGLAFLLDQMGKRVEIANDGGIDQHCRWLPGVDQIMSGPEQLSGQQDTVVAVDCANRERLGSLSDVLTSDVTVINIDHHETNGRYGDVNWIEPERSSVGEMIFEIWERSEHDLFSEPATCLYASIVSDTGQFSFSQTSSRSHEIAVRLLDTGVEPPRVSRRLFQDFEKSELDLMAKVIHNIKRTSARKIAWSTLGRDAYEQCGAEPWDSQPYVQMVMKLRDVEIGLLLRRLHDPEISGKHQGNIKGSLRSRGSFDVGEIAGMFGGGGHPQAAGFVVEGRPSKEEVEERVIQRIKEVVEDGSIARQ